MPSMRGAVEASRSTPGNDTRIAEPGLKPSLPFHGVGSMRTPLALAGRDSAGKRTRLPVGESGSATVKKSLGRGRRQRPGTRGSQRSAVERSMPSSRGDRAADEPPSEQATRPIEAAAQASIGASRVANRSVSRDFDRMALSSPAVSAERLGAALAIVLTAPARCQARCELAAWRGPAGCRARPSGTGYVPRAATVETRCGAPPWAQAPGES